MTSIFFMGDEMDIDAHIESRIAECQKESRSYEAWLRTLRVPNFLLVGIGSLLAFLGGTAIVAGMESLGKYAGFMAMLGGALTGLHSWLGCDAHQAKCSSLAGKFEGLKSRYEALKVEADEQRRGEALRSIEADLARIQEERTVRPWNAA